MPVIESVGNKFFKSITETADEIGGRFEIVLTNFSNKVADDADILTMEITSLSFLIKILLLVSIIFLLLIIFKYITFGVLFLRNYYLGNQPQLPAKQLFRLATSTKIEPAMFNKDDYIFTTVV